MIVNLYLRRKGDDPEAQALLERLRNDGYRDLRQVRMEKVFRLQGLSAQDALRLKPLFCNAVSETLLTETGLEDSGGPVVEIGYQRAVTDPELPSILHGAQALGISGLEWARIFHRYQFTGLDEAAAQQAAGRYLFNPQVQVMIGKDEVWDSLKPRGESGGVVPIPLKGLSRKELGQISDSMRLFMNSEQMSALQRIETKTGRPLTDAEVEMFAQTWSDHCYHTTWKSLRLLEALQAATHEIGHELVLSAFEDNAGVMAFYEGWALTVKGETHNSPTAVSPYGGIMTKHGGVIRDTLGCGQGANPIGGSTVMGIGDPRMVWKDVPRGALHPKTILFESIRGTADYVNPMGIPMMFPVYRFHPGYTGKCFALGHSIGLIPAARAQKGKPRPGDHVILLGGPTGRDGLHGATVSSDSMTHDTAEKDAAHVQIGHPIEERKFMEAIPALRDADCIRAITDLGAGGLSSAAGEMGSETGIWINLSLVPLKTSGLLPWEIWISESQERMLLCCAPEKTDQALSLLKKYQVAAEIIGCFTESGRCRVVVDPSGGFSPPGSRDAEKVVDLPFEDLRKGCPLPSLHPARKQRAAVAFSPPVPRSGPEWLDAFKKILGHPNLCSQAQAGTQFDSTVQGCTVTGPYDRTYGMPNDIWASAPLRGKPYGAVSAIAFNPFYGELDPAGLAKLMILEAAGKLVAAGTALEDMVFCDNFYTPAVTPAIAWDLQRMVEICCELSRTLGIPFISGKDSSSGSFIGENGFRLDVPPTLAVLSLGRIPDVWKLIPKPWTGPGNDIFLIGPFSGSLGGSVYLDTFGRRGDKLPDPDAGQVLAAWKKLRALQAHGIIRSAAAIGGGGIFLKAFEMSLGSGLGCRLNAQSLMGLGSRLSLDAALFAESIGCIMVETLPGQERIMEDSGAVRIGRTLQSRDLIIALDEEMTFPMEELAASWAKPFSEIFH
ncbi:hypothetical protein JW906_01140 [bacterium]|nr:hypothetical protein [bacterium]